MILQNKYKLLKLYPIKFKKVSIKKVYKCIMSLYTLKIKWLTNKKNTCKKINMKKKKRKNTTIYILYT